MISLISTNPAILGGKPFVTGTRLSVEFLLNLLAGGATPDDIVNVFPQITLAGIEAAIRFSPAASDETAG